MPEDDTLDSPEPPPPFDPNTAEPWDDLRDPWFSSAREAEEWDGESVYADGPQELNEQDPPVQKEDDDGAAE